MVFTFNDFALISATLLGPILAVQVQKVIEHTRAGHQGRERIFKTLMATRAQMLAPQHIEALNLIDLSMQNVKGRKHIEDKPKWNCGKVEIQSRFSLSHRVGMYTDRG